MLLAFVGVCLMMIVNQPSNAQAAKKSYDLSEWQGLLTAKQVKKLKHEVPFVILRVQYGSTYNDRTFNYNRRLLNKYKVPYGVYSYSLYTSKASAAREARLLYQRAPKAKFYVNDFEVTSMGSKLSNAATRKWAKTMKKLTKNKRRILFYSYLSFMQAHAAKALKSYSGYWVASYSNYEPAVPHVMWQYTDRHYSGALNKHVDASKLRRSKKWFVGKKKKKAKAKIQAQAQTQNQNQGQANTNMDDDYGYDNPSIAVEPSKANAQPIPAPTTQHVKKHTKKRHVKKIAYQKKRVKKHAKKHVKKHIKKRHVRK